MSISESLSETSRRVGNLAVAREAAVVGLLATGISALLSPVDMGLGVLRPHPVWLAALVLAARYGGRGLLLGLAAGWSSTLLALALLRPDVSWMAARAGLSGDLEGLVAVVLVAGVASIHQRRTRDLVDRTAKLESACAEKEGIVAELRVAAGKLRARADRLETSLTFLREVARRLEGNDPEAAAQAALELALARTGARAGAVQIAERGRLRMLAWTGLWSGDAPMPPDLVHDRTAAVAFEQRRGARVEELPGRKDDDSDMAAPAFGSDGGVLGVVALRGVPAEATGIASIHDLSVIAGWLGSSLSARSSATTTRPEEPAGGEAAEAGETAAAASLGGEAQLLT